MTKIDELLLQLTRASVAQLKLAILGDCAEWAYNEVEFIHNLPSLIGREVGSVESCPHSHFWQVEIPAFLKWVGTQNEDRKHVVRVMYLPLIKEIGKAYQSHWPGLDGMETVDQWLS